MFIQSILLADCWLCNVGIWLPLLLSLIPFFLGVWFQSFTTRKWRLRTEALEKEIKDLKGTITGLEKDLEDCAYARNRLDGEVAMLKGRSREMEGQIEHLGVKLKTSEEDLSKAYQEKEDLASALEEAKSAPIQMVPNAIADDATIDTNEEDKEVSDSDDHSENLATGDLEQDAMDAIADVDKAASDIVDDQVSDASGRVDDISSAAAPIAGAGLGSLEDSSSSLGGDLSEDQLAAGKSVFGFKIKQDDLKLIEGVGPKIEGLLKDGGLKTWAAVGNAKVDDIKKILEDAGPRYRLADPTTWAQQAGLAAKGEWQALKEFQDRLDGGRLG